MWLNWQSSWFVISRFSVRVRSSASRNRKGTLAVVGPCHGGIPEWPKGADCKSVSCAFSGSNPLSPTLVYLLDKPLFNFISRGGAVWKLVGLITRRSQVQILSSQLEEYEAHVSCSSFIRCPDSSVGRAEDWKSSCHWFDSGSGHFFNSWNLFRNFFCAIGKILQRKMPP